MSHEFESGFVVKEPAWHGLATVLTECPSIADAIVEAGLDWEVLQSPVYARVTLPGQIVPDGEVKAEGFLANVRATDAKILGIVSEKYKPLQNKDAFEWFQPFLDKGDCQLESAGSLKEGKIVWVLAKILAQKAEVTDGDLLEAFLLLSGAHDGTRAVTVGFTPIRVVCWNTASAAHRGLDSHADNRTGKAIRIRHVGDVKGSLKGVQKTIDIAARRLEDLAGDARVLQSRQVDPSSFLNFLEQVYAPEREAIREKLQEAYRAMKDETLSDKAREIAKEAAMRLEEKLARPFRKQTTVDRITMLLEKGPGSEMAGKTLWGAVNAVTHYEEHCKSDDAARLLHASWFGGAVRDYRERAYDVAASMI